MSTHTTPSQRHAVGLRAEEIAKLTQEEFPIPGGFILTPETFSQVLSHDRLKQAIASLIPADTAFSQKQLSKFSAQIKRLITHAQIPHDIATDVLQMYVKMGSGKVMITPSFISEEAAVRLRDVSLHSYGYHGDANVFVGIRNAWASFFQSQVISKRQKNTANQLELPYSLCIQQQPKGYVTGVLYTNDPTANRKASMLIKAVWGEGAYTKDLEGADYYWIDQQRGSELEYIRCDQHEEYVWNQGQMVSATTPQSRVGKRKIDERFVREVHKIGKKLQQTLFFPQECVFCFDGKQFWIIETKPLMLDGHIPSTLNVQPGSSQAIGSGVEITPGFVSGVVQIVTLAQQPKSIVKDAILVAKSLAYIKDEHIRQAKGIILEEVHKTSGKTFLLTKYGIPCISQVSQATTQLKGGMRISFNTHTGIISRAITRQLPVHVSPQVKTSVTHIYPIIALGDEHPLSHTSSVLINPNPFFLAHAHAGHSRHATMMVYQKFLDELETVLYGSQSTSCVYTLSTHGNSPKSQFVGSAKLIYEPESYHQEIETLKTFISLHPTLFTTIALPFPRSASEYIRATRKLTAVGLSRSGHLKHALVISVAGLVTQLPRCIDHGVDADICDSDGLSNNLFSLSEKEEFDAIETEEKIQVLVPVLQQILTLCADAGVPVSLTGQVIAEYGILDLVKEFSLDTLYTRQSQIESLQTRLTDT